MYVPPEVIDAARSARVVTVFTGAGMSAESGIATYRDVEDGLWSQYDPRSFATVDAWRSDRDMVWAWYQKRCARVLSSAPNAGHLALASWGAARDVRVVTQNVDDLHERAGSSPVIHVHGSLFAFRCDTCDAPRTVDVVDPVTLRDPPPSCGCGGHVRPGVVWFGEMLPENEFASAIDAVQRCDLLLTVGTAGVVYPAAGLPQLARNRGATVVEINPEETDLSGSADVVWRANAAAALPALVTAVESANSREGQDR